MKRFFTLLLALCLCMSLFACNKQPVDVETPPVETPGQTEDPVPTPDPAPVPDPEPAPTPDPEPQPDPEPVQPEDPSVEVDEAHYFYMIHDHNMQVTSEASAVVRATFNMPEIETMPYVTDYYTQVQSDLFNVYCIEGEDALLQKQDLGENFRPWEMEMSFEVLRNDGTVLSILRQLYENRNGAHPSLVFFAETYGVESQGRLLLANLFTVSEDEYLARLRDMIVAQMDRNETENGGYYFDFAREQLLSLLDPMDFALTEDSLLIFFDEYALAPYAAGMQHIYLPLSELSDILDTQWVTQ